MQSKYIIFFDGECTLCNGAVRFIINRDKDEKFKFGNIKSEKALSFLREHGIEIQSEPDSIIVYTDDLTLRKSEAVIYILKNLNALWPIFATFLSLFPKNLSDDIYDFVARNRTKWFGKTNVCAVSDSLNNDRLF